MRKTLQKAGYKVDTAPDGFQASEMISLKYYHLILMEIHMPGKSGLELCGEIKEKSPGTKVIIVTVDDKKEILSDVSKAGVFAFLNKPVKRNDIINHVAQALNIRQML